MALLGPNNPMYGKHMKQETKEQLSKFFSSEQNPNLKKVICINTGEVFPGSSFAAQKYNIKNSGDIGQCCKGKRRTCGKDKLGHPLQWQFYDDWIVHPKQLSHSNTAIVCLNTKQIFETAKQAAEWAGLKSSGGIRECCNGGKQYTSGIHPDTKEPLRWCWYKEIADNI